MNTMKKMLIVGIFCISQVYGCIECDGVIPTLLQTICAPVAVPLFYIKSVLKDRKDAQEIEKFFKKSSIEKIEYLKRRKCTYEEMMSIAIRYEDLDFMQAIFTQAGNALNLNYTGLSGVPYCEIKSDAIYRIYTNVTLLDMAVKGPAWRKKYDITSFLLQHGANPNLMKTYSRVKSGKTRALLQQYGAVA